MKLSLYKHPELYEQVAYHHAETEKEVSALDEIFQGHDVKTVADIACGIGRHTIALSECGYTVTGIDISIEQITYAKEKARRKGVTPEFLCIDIHNYHALHVFDAAICMWTTFAEEGIDQNRFLQNIYAALKPGGICVIENPVWPDTLEPLTSTREFYLPTKQHVIQEISDKFERGCRTRVITYSIDGKSFFEERLTKVLHFSDIKNYMQTAGFKMIDAQYGYKNKKDMLVFGKK